MKQLTIATEHSVHSPKQFITINLMGGSPYFNYIWINDVCYTVTKTDRSVKIHKTK